MKKQFFAALAGLLALLLAKHFIPIPPPTAPTQTSQVENQILQNPAQTADPGKRPLGPAKTPMAHPELQILLSHTYKSFPHIGDMKNKTSEEVHHTPIELVRAGDALGELAEYLQTHPSEAKEATDFYATCAADATLMPAVRALCYQSIMDKSADWTAEIKEKLSHVSKDIIDIAKQL